MQITFSFLLTLLFALSSGGAFTQPEPQQVKEQINKTIQLSPGANVTVGGINGRVNIETWDSQQAEIHITITASSREALEARPLLVTNTPDSLVIRTENDREGRGWGRDRGWVRHEVNLKVPRQINAKVSGVNGTVHVGAITGTIHASGINGRTEIVQAGTASQLSGINGGVRVSLLRLGPEGLRVSGINGGVEVGLPDGTNADIDVSGTNGGVDSDLPLAVIGEVKRGQLKGTLGSGGTPIRVSGVNGGVKLRRN